MASGYGLVTKLFKRLLNLLPSRPMDTQKLSIANELIAILLEEAETSRVQIQKLQDVIANKKTKLATTVDKLSITAHAIHRYRQRHNGKGTDEDISKMLHKCLLNQLATTDKLQDGEYVLKKGVVGVVANNTLVTVLPTRKVNTPSIKNLKKVLK